MTDTILLDVTASPAVMPVVRMVVSGVGARLDFSLDEIGDLALAVEELLSTARSCGEGPRHTLTVTVGDGIVTISTGPFRSPELRAQVTPQDDPAPSFNLATVFTQVVDSVEICGGDPDCYAVAFSKRHGVG